VIAQLITADPQCGLLYRQHIHPTPAGRMQEAPTAARHRGFRTLTATGLDWRARQF
jgi:hypothetical protein